MAGKREIKTTLALDGEQKFKKAMSDAASAIKELNSEQKLAEAQFEATGDAEHYAAEQTRILKEKIAEQQKVVEAAESAVERMKRDGVDPNSKAMVTWRTKLNQAKTSLTNMQTALERTEGELDDQGQALDDASTDAGEYQDAMKKAAEAVDFSATITAIENLRERIGTIISRAAQAGKALWEMESGAGKWADEIQTAADVAELDVETYQAWRYASRFVDTSVESIVGSYNKLNKKLDEPTDEILESLNELNVAHLNMNGTARDSMEVFFNIVDALGRVENKSRRDQLAMELLGKSYNELNPLIKAGSKAFLDYAEEGRAVAVVSKEQMEALTSLDDANQKLEATFENTKYTLLSEIAGPFQQVSEAMTMALGSFNDFIQTAEGQEALNSLRNALGGIAERVAQTDWKEAMDKASGIISGITSGLAWLAEHSEVVVGAIGGLALAWSGLTVAKDVLSVLQLLNTIKWAQISKVVASGAANEVGKKAAVSTGKKVLSAGKNIGLSLLGKAGAALEAAPVLLPAAMIPVTGAAFMKLDEAANQREWGNYRETVESEMTNLLQENDQKNADKYQEILQAFVEAINGPEEMDLEADLSQPFKDAFRKYGPALLEAFPELDFWDMVKFSADTSDGLDTAEIENIIRNVENADTWVGLGREISELIASGLKSELPETDISEAWDQSGRQAAERLAKSIQAEGWLPTSAAEEMARQTQTAMDSIDAKTVGYNTGAGLAEGIYESFPLAVGAAEAMGDAVASALQWKLEIQSPSKVMARLGRFVSMGFAKGIEDNVGAVERATNRMAYATMGRAVKSAPAAAGSGGSGGMVHVTLILDGKTVGDVITPYVDSNIAAQVSRRR